MRLRSVLLVALAVACRQGTPRSDVPSAPPAAQMDAEHAGPSSGPARDGRGRDFAVAAELGARRERIVAEIERLGDHPWAGSYFLGDLFDVHVYLDLAPDAGFAFRWAGCAGDTDRNWGSVREADGELHLVFELPNERGEYWGCPEVLRVVPWGARRYLIEPAELGCFVGYVNDGDEPRDGGFGHFLLREGDGSRPADGLPGLPPDWLVRIDPERRPSAR